MLTPAARNVALGIMLLARGRAAGLRHFAGTKQSLLAALAPLVAFPLVATGLLLASGEGLDALTQFFEFLCGILTPLVISFELARRWRRQPAWLQYATAFCWCQWAVPLVAALLLLASAPAMWLGLPGTAAATLLLLVLAGYALWLQWFLARHGLGLTAARAAGLVAIVNSATGLVLTALPFLAGSPG